MNTTIAIISFIISIFVGQQSYSFGSLNDLARLKPAIEKYSARISRNNGDLEQNATVISPCLVVATFHQFYGEDGLTVTKNGQTFENSALMNPDDQREMGISIYRTQSEIKDLGFSPSELRHSPDSQYMSTIWGRNAEGQEKMARLELYPQDQESKNKGMLFTGHRARFNYEDVNNPSERNGLSGLPVVDLDGNLVGIFSEESVVPNLRNMKEYFYYKMASILNGIYKSDRQFVVDNLARYEEAFQQNSWAYDNVIGKQKNCESSTDKHSLSDHISRFETLMKSHSNSYSTKVIATRIEAIKAKLNLEVASSSNAQTTAN